MSKDTLDRARGSFLGLAVGDAIGTTLEFSKRDSKPPLTDMVGGGVFNLRPGEWTDDTAMALCLADCIIECKGGFNPHVLMSMFSAWRFTGWNSCTRTCFDVGNQTAKAIEDYRTTLKLPKKSRAAGNGSIMRLAPAAIARWNSPGEAVKLCREQSAVTHPGKVALDCCESLALTISTAIQGSTSIPRTKWKNRSEVVSNGHAPNTLMAAYWCVNNHTGFEAAVLAAANLGDDADTTAAVTGQIAGALYGESGIPARWLKKLAWQSHIKRLATELHEIGSLHYGK